MEIIHTILSWLIPQLRRPWFWLSLILGSALSLVTYQEVLSKFWGIESLRVKLTAIFLFVLLTGACFFTLTYFLLPRIKEFSKVQRAGIFGFILVVPLILFFALNTFDNTLLIFQDFSKDTINFLLPSHTISIEVPAAPYMGSEDLVLSQFRNSVLGDISLNALTKKGWERRGDQLFLTDYATNQITWRGKVGYNATIIFKSRSNPVDISISWDGKKEIYSLFSITDQYIVINKQFPVPFYAGWVLDAIAIVLSVLFVTLVILVGFLMLPGFNAFTPHNKWDWLMFAIPMYLVWSIYLLVFWPGFLSADSIDQWEQMLTGQYVNWHPVAHTLTIWFITHLWNSPAAMAILQILVLGGVLGWGIATLREVGLPIWLCWLGAVFLAILPSNSVFSITLWKDILFSTAVVALTVIVLKLVVTRGLWVCGRTSWFSMGIVLIFVSLYRQNGFFVAFISLIFLGWTFRKYWKSFAKTTCLFLLVYSLFTGPIFRLLSVKSLDKARYPLVIANLLAGHMEAGTYFSPQDLSVLKPAFPTDVWPYDCYRNLPFIFSSALDRNYLTAHTQDLLTIALKVTFENPLVTIKHFACQGAFVYRIPQDPDHYESVILDIVRNNFGISRSSVLPNWYSPLYQYINHQVQNPAINWIIWGMPFWMYLCVIGCVFFMIRNKTWQPVLVVLPGLLTVLPYIILSLGQIFRYVYPMYLIGILLSGYFWLCKLPKDYVVIYGQANPDKI